MALVKYTPFGELRGIQEQMNRLFDLTGEWGAGEEFQEGIWQPLVDIYEDENSIVIKADLPEIDQKDIEVKIEENTLVIHGERKHASEFRKEKYHRIERCYGQFHRSFSLPHTVDDTRVKASCDRGVLTIILPKKEESKPRQISIKVT
jgi:HSP20 family protein